MEGRSLRFLKLQERSHLLYYPVYLVRFRYRGRLFRISLDGHDGSVIDAHLPVAPRAQVAALLGGALGAALLTAAPLRLLLFPPAGISELGGLARLWALWGLATAGVLYAGRLAAARIRFNSERVLRG